MKKLYISSGILVTLLLLSSFIFFGGCTKKEEAVVVWHWMSDRHAAFQDLAKKYEEETGVKVQFELFAHHVYSSKVTAAAVAKDLPDLFGILGEKKIFAGFVRNGFIENLTPYMLEAKNSWKKRFIEISLAFNTFEDGNVYGVTPGIYGVPIDTMSIQFLYNRDLVKKAGLNPDRGPRSWSEFLDVAKELSKEKGVSGFVCGWGENWFMYCLATNYAFNIMGEDKFFATMRGEVPYTDPDWVKVFSLFEELKKSGILAQGIITMNNKESERAFANNKAAFSFNGSWGINTYKQINPDLNFDTILPPRLKSKYSPKIWAGAGSSFVVSASSKFKLRAINFLKWLTQKEQQLFLIEKTRNLPSIKGCEKNIDPAMRKFLKNMRDTTHPNLWPLNEESKVIEAINIGIQKILIGEKTPQEVSQDVAKAKQLIMEMK